MVFTKKKAEGESHFKSVLLAYFILVFHLLLIAGLLLLVIFFRGVVNYMIWIFLFGSAMIIASGYHFYKRMKREGKTLQEMLRQPLLSGRSVEVSFLGGLATFKIGRADDLPALGSDSRRGSLQLEDPDAVRIRELLELVRMFENDLITLDEYNRIKQQIFKSS
ncbi:MAG: hypothetical protein ABII68_09945 [Pseudomonadota bacterium]